MHIREFKYIKNRISRWNNNNHNCVFCKRKVFCTWIIIRGEKDAAERRRKWDVGGEGEKGGIIRWKEKRKKEKIREGKGRLRNCTEREGRNGDGYGGGSGNLTDERGKRERL